MPNLQEAMAYIRKAAEKGHPKAQVELAGAYRAGQGVSQDLTQAAFWLSLALEQGSPAARVMLPQVEGKLTAKQRSEVELRVASWKREHQPVALV